MKLITALILGVIFLIAFSFILRVTIIIRRRRGISDSDESDRLKKNNSSIQFFITDAGSLLRYYKGNWSVLNPQKMKWEIPTFEIEDLFTARSISEKEAGKMVRNMFNLRGERKV